MLTLLPPFVCLLCCSWYGFMLSSRLESRAKLLSEHSRLLAAIRKNVIAVDGEPRRSISNFKSDSKPMQTLLADLQARLSSYGGESMSSAYISCASLLVKQRLLTYEDTECFSRALGFEEKLTRVSSAAVIDAEAPKLNELALLAEEKRRRDSKLIRNGGMLIGLMLFILLL